jgi:hypothetical protein
MAAKARKDKQVVRSDAYVGMLFVSLVAMIIGAALLYMDYSQYPSEVPSPVKAAAGGGAVRPPQGGQQGSGSQSK